MKGAKTLYLRIRYAAETLRESAATWGKKEGEACVNKAINDAVARVKGACKAGMLCPKAPWMDLRRPET